MLVALASCAPRPCVLEIVDYPESAPPRVYHGTFREGYYDYDAAGNLSIVLHNKEPGADDPSLDVEQIVHFQTLWRPVPGKNHFERTQINGRMTYAVLLGGVGATFEGAGSVFVREDRGSNELTGTLGLATLSPARQLAGGGALFRKATVSGRFRAVRDAREVTRIVNDLERRFGPPPPHEPPASP